MKTFERLLIKVIIIQLACLFFFQFLLSRHDQIFDLTKLSRYEGVTSNNYTKIIETFNETGSKSGD
ncbi:YpfB family protein [Bacillus sp. CFBP9009]